MSSLLENILNKNQKVDFDFSKSYNKQIKSESSHLGMPYNLDNQLPVSPESSSWETVYDGVEQLKKIYRFKTMKHMIYFINESLREADRRHHHPGLNIQGLDIEVSLYTHDVNQVTENDLALSKFFDEIYEDIFYIRGF